MTKTCRRHHVALGNWVADGRKEGGANADKLSASLCLVMTYLGAFGGSLAGHCDGVVCSDWFREK